VQCRIFREDFVKKYLYFRLEIGRKFINFGANLSILDYFFRISKLLGCCNQIISDIYLLPSLHPLRIDNPDHVTHGYYKWYLIKLSATCLLCLYQLFLFHSSPLAPLPLQHSTLDSLQTCKKTYSPYHRNMCHPLLGNWFVRCLKEWEAIPLIPLLDWSNTFPPVLLSTDLIESFFLKIGSNFQPNAHDCWNWHGFLKW